MKIIALTTGIAVGLRCEDNKKVAIVERGMAEITRLGNAMGCFEQTFFCSAGMDDFNVTLTSERSRKYHCVHMNGVGMDTK